MFIKIILFLFMLQNDIFKKLKLRILTEFFSDADYR